MSTEFRLYDVDDKDLYRNKTKEEKEALKPKIVEIAKVRGIKPTARYFNTYPSTVRQIIKKYEDKENDSACKK